jgi:hypothetical protein
MPSLALLLGASEPLADEARLLHGAWGLFLALTGLLAAFGLVVVLGAVARHRRRQTRRRATERAGTPGPDPWQAAADRVRPFGESDS